MMIDRAQAQYAIDQMVDQFGPRERDDAGDVYYARVDAEVLATLVLLAARATGYDVDGDEIATLSENYETGNTLQSILDYYAS